MDEVFSRMSLLEIFDDIELPKITENMNTRELTCFVNYTYILISATTCARSLETALIKVKDIDFHQEYITFYHTKNDKPRSIKIFKYLINKLLGSVATT